MQSGQQIKALGLMVVDASTVNQPAETLAAHCKNKWRVENTMHC